MRVKQLLVLVFSIFCATSYLVSDKYNVSKPVISDEHYELVLMSKNDKLVLVSTKMDYMDEFETYQKKVEVMSQDFNEFEAVIPKDTKLLSITDSLNFSDEILNYEINDLDNLNQVLGFVFSEHSEKNICVNNEINNELQLDKYFGMVNLFNNLDNQMYKSNIAMVFNEQDGILYPNVVRTEKLNTIEIIELYYNNYYSAINDSLSLDNLKISEKEEKLMINVDSSILDENNNLDIKKIEPLLFSIKYNTKYTNVDVYIKDVFIKSVDLNSLIINKI